MPDSQNAPLSNNNNNDGRKYIGQLWLNALFYMKSSTTVPPCLVESGLKKVKNQKQ